MNRQAELALTRTVDEPTPSSNGLLATFNLYIDVKKHEVTTTYDYQQHICSFRLGSDLEAFNHQLASYT